ncbi:MAG: hypothetical protein RR115_03885 [Hydrogenoanaerobacterium sp.]
MTKSNKAGTFFIAAMCVFLAVTLLAFSQAVSIGVRNGLSLCGEIIIPSLFPFMILFGFLSQSRASLIFAKLLSPVTKLLNLPANAAAPLLGGIIGGYPVGARNLAVMVREHRLSSDNASRMLCFCVNAGPPFLLCAVGSEMLFSRPLGTLLLTSQILSSMVIGLVIGVFTSKAKQNLTEPLQNTFRPYSFCLVQAVKDAASGIFTICAFVVTFQALSALVAKSGIAELFAVKLAELYPNIGAELINGIILGILEVTAGCKALSKCGFAGIICIAGLISFSGISVIFQILASVHGSDIKIGAFIASRFIHCGLTVTFFMILLKIFPQSCAAALSLTTPIKTQASSVSGSVSLMLMCAVFLFGNGKNELSQNKKMTKKTCKSRV